MIQPEPETWAEIEKELEREIAMTREACMDAPPEGTCDHKFVDSPHCLKCGWIPAE
jgi:hypothetical protein